MPGIGWRCIRITLEMDAYTLDWLNLLLRWLHIITGIAWIGASFYFIWLDNSLEAPTKAGDIDRGDRKSTRLNSSH